MTVFDNMSFALKLAKVAPDEIKKKVEAAAEKLNLSAYLKRTPKELSGGQLARGHWPRHRARPQDILV